jgi:hypothetical protein
MQQEILETDRRNHQVEKINHIQDTKSFFFHKCVRTDKILANMDATKDVEKCKG